MRVVICGAGIGGLTLAQALRDDVELTVLDRDPSATATGGYRLALNGAATAVLERHLAPPLMAQLRAVSDRRQRFAQFSVADSRLRPIVIAAEDVAEDRLLAQRRALRLLLTRGLEDRIAFGSTVTRVVEEADHAEVHSDDGRHHRADLVVGAEGTRSPTVQAVAGRATDSGLGLVGIAGSTAYEPDRSTPPWLRHGPGLAIDHTGTGLFLSLTSSGSGPLPLDLIDAVGPPSLVWGLIAPDSLLRGVSRRDPTELVAVTLAALRRWHGWLPPLIRAADPDRVAAFDFRAADPTADLTPWAPRRVTALGDAVHAMPPTGGQAAATAIRDAGCLAEQLLAHRRDGLPLTEALDRYHRAFPEWARPALTESLGPVRVIRALRNPLLSAAARPGLALAGRWGRIRYAPRSRPRSASG